MVKNSKECFEKESKMDMEFIRYLMEGHTWDIGSMVNSMVKEFTK
mgnify:CR=1 FL=1